MLVGLVLLPIRLPETLHGLLENWTMCQIGIWKNLCCLSVWLWQSEEVHSRDNVTRSFMLTETMATDWAHIGGVTFYVLPGRRKFERDDKKV